MILDYNLEDVPELKAVAPGEYSLTIINVEEKVDKNGNPGILVMMKIADEEAKSVTTWLSLPGDDDEVEVKNRKLRNLKRFLECFSLTLPLEVSDMVGSEGWAILRLEDDEEYGEQNRIKRFLVQN